MEAATLAADRQRLKSDMQSGSSIFRSTNSYDCQTISVKRSIHKKG